MNEKDVLKFERDFMTGDVICFNAGHLTVHDKYRIRILLSPLGLQLIVPQEAIDAGAVMVMSLHERS